MTLLYEEARKKRSFVSPHLILNSWSAIETYFDILESSELLDIDAIKEWLIKRSELESVIEEEKAWRYIKLSCDTGNKKLEEEFNRFTAEIEPHIHKQINKLDKKLIAACKNLEIPASFNVFIRSIKQGLEIFREENIPLLSELEIEEQQYSAVAGAMTIDYKGDVITLQQAQNFLTSLDRNERKKVFDLIRLRRMQDRETLDNLLSSLITKRTQIAHNADFKTYTEYRFAQMNRFDYTPDACYEFHEAIKSEVVPLIDRLFQKRKEKLNLDNLKPYDLEVDADQKPALVPFSSIEDLITKSIECYTEIDQDFGSYLDTMNRQGYLDLDSRKGKAPGGYNYPLYESNVPFIFMNATKNLRDIETMMHEGGHAIHSFLSKDLEYVFYKELTPEIAELASMSMELISMEHWHHFFDDDDLRRAKRSQLEQVIMVLPWIATIDKFQHWIYTHPQHSTKDRAQTWLNIRSDFKSKVVDWSDYADFHEMMWQKQIHIYQFPFYYIEYGMAQLGAIAIWKNYKKNKVKTLEQFKQALSMGYSKTIPEVYKTAGIEFNFQKEYIKSLMDFVSYELTLI